MAHTKNIKEDEFTEAQLAHVAMAQEAFSTLIPKKVKKKKTRRVSGMPKPSTLYTSEELVAQFRMQKANNVTNNVAKQKLDAQKQSNLDGRAQCLDAANALRMPASSSSTPLDGNNYTNTQL